MIIVRAFRFIIFPTFNFATRCLISLLLCWVSFFIFVGVFSSLFPEKKCTTMSCTIMEHGRNSISSKDGLRDFVFKSMQVYWPRTKNLIQFYGALLQRDTNYIQFMLEAAYNFLSFCYYILKFHSHDAEILKNLSLFRETLLMPSHLMEHKVSALSSSPLHFQPALEQKASWNFMVCDEKWY